MYADRQAELEPENPWPPWLSFATMASAMAAWTAGLVELARNRSWKLLVFIVTLVVAATTARKELCARCPYYGRYCTMLIGKWTALLYERSEKPLTTACFLWDGMTGGLLFMLPIPEVLEGSLWTRLCYLASVASFFSLSMRYSCRRCRTDICPVNISLRMAGFKK